MSSSPSPQETEIKILEIYKALEETFSGKDTKKINEAKNKLNEIFKDVKSAIELLFIALTKRTIAGKEITLDLHKSVLIYLKNLFYSYKNIMPDDIYNYLMKIFDLIFNKSQENQNLMDYSIFSIFQTIISFLLSNQKIIDDNKNYIGQLFNILLDSIKNVPNEKFLVISKSVILLSTSLLTSRSANSNNFEILINDNYIPIINIVFLNVPKFLDPKNNIYNKEYIIILKYLLDGFYSCLSRMRTFYNNEKRKEITMKLFKEYGNYCFELIQLSPSFDEKTKSLFEKPNPILVFNNDEKLCVEMNNMKSKAIQFLSFITQVSTLEDKKMDDDEKNLIPDKELVELLNKLIGLIITSFGDILQNKNKFDLIRKFNGESEEEEDSYNMLLFQICVFLTRSLIRDPIKTEFISHIRTFLLNYLFPMLITMDDEKVYSETDPEGYHQYISDIISEFKIKRFRTSGCFLIKKICDKFEDMSNFMLSFCLEMLNYLLNEGRINEQLKDINIYLKNKDSLINQFNDKKKLDFALLIILILREKLKNSQYLKNKLIELLVQNNEKIHSIPFPIIKIKLCKIYYYFIPRFFENNKTIQEDIKRKFIENVVNYLLNNIIQKDLETGEEYSQALSYGSSETILELLNLPKDSECPENSLLNLYVTKNLENNFGIINQLIENVDIYTFFIVIDHIIGTIKINQRSLVFESINYLTKKFQKIFLNQNEENKLYLSQYFTIISSFLLGVNKINPGNKEEIAKFNEYFGPIIKYIKNPKKFLLYEHLVSTMEEYMKCLGGINEESALILKNIKLIVEKDKTLPSVCFSYVSTFLNFIQINISDKPLNQEELFNDILEIIKKSYMVTQETLKTSKINALLLTFQILNLNPNLNNEIIEYLILQSFGSFELAEVNEDIVSTRENINQLSLANVSLGFIFKPELTYQILTKNKFVIEREGQRKEIPIFVKYINYIKEILDISEPGNYSPTLGKCIILGICGIFSNQNCIDNLKGNMDQKLILLIMFLKLVIFHKNQKNTILNKLMKKETNCNFVQDNDNDEEDEEEEEDSFEEDEEFNSDIDKALKGNDNIKNSDEFKFFSNVIKNIKERDKDLYSYLVNMIDKGEKIVDDLSFVRNIKIKYKEREFTVPRKTVKIIRQAK